ncbi:hypothetical protein UZ36_03285 [Candidatus Nitromaritima sp. SCGC AAA799-C22]|nr:hypothetical protein UZ36_03285 [Candidatus Nitromaritima sp. SCGC AAA799-C22]
MKLMLSFVKTMFRMPLPWALWVGSLMAVNMMGPLLFIDRIEAQVVLAATMAGGAIMMGVYSTQRYVRLLGIGHILWVPMVPWLATRDALAMDTPYGLWLLAVVVMDGFSLVVDFADVMRYVKGEREPWITSGSQSA